MARAALQKARRIRQRLNPVIALSLERHAERSDVSKTGLTRKGIAQAFRKGKTLPAGFRLKGYSSPTMRTIHTLKFSQGSARAAVKKTYPAERIKKELGLGFIHNMEKLIELDGKLGEEKVLRLWLDGKLSEKFVDKPEGVADRLIRKRFRLGAKIFQKGRKKIMLRNVSHYWVIEAVFERLTGRKFNFTEPTNTIARLTEGLAIYFTPYGKSILEYRKKRYDITANLKKILESK